MTPKTLMKHLPEGSLQTYLDDEMDAADRGAVRQHVSECLPCAAELETLRHASRSFGAAVATLDVAISAVPVPVPMPARRAVRWQRAAHQLARAAAVVIMLGAGAALLSGTSVGDWASNLLDQARAVFAPDAPPGPDAGAAPAAIRDAGVEVVPRSETIRVEIDDAAPGVLVRVRLVEGGSAWLNVIGGTEEPHFRVSPGRGTVSAGDADVVEISVPRQVRNAVVEMNGRAMVRKEGDQLRSLVDEGRQAARVLEFRVGRDP